MGMCLAQRPKWEPENEKSITDVPIAIHSATLIQLPSEIIQHILSILPCQSLVSLTRTCRSLQHHASNDQLWARLLRPNLAPRDFPPTPHPSISYRNLYISHHPYWFLPRSKLWFSDDPHTGRIMLIKFDRRRGCIEGYRLLADRGDNEYQTWDAKPGVTIHAFRPRVHLWLDDPILKIPHASPDSPTASSSSFNTRQGWWDGEIKMRIGRAGHNTSGSFFLSREVSPHLLHKSMAVWPPRTIPNMPRVRAASQDKFRGSAYKPQKYAEISQTTFRMRQWSQFSIERAFFGVRMGEEVSTWSTLDPCLYTPTAKKPYQGIFVGDYAGHGCEFLLVMQTEKAPGPRPEWVGRTMRHGSPRSVEDSAGSRYYSNLSATALASLAEVERAGVFNGEEVMEDEDEVHLGAIEAVKLTGDPNIPRGEYTFIADDIGVRGLIKIAEDEPFKGARIVRSRGHCAERGFVNDEFVPSQLIMLSPDRLAQYWVPFGHVSYYQRVDIDRLLEQASNGDRDRDGDVKGDGE